jgi:hypothetical protein
MYTDFSPATPRHRTGPGPFDFTFAPYTPPSEVPVKAFKKAEYPRYLPVWQRKDEGTKFDVRATYKEDHMLMRME